MSQKIHKDDLCSFDKESKTGLDFEIGQPQQKVQRRPTLQSLVNPAVMKRDRPPFVWVQGVQMNPNMNDTANL